MSEPNTVDVGCRIPNGVRLSVTKWIDDPQDKGKKIAREGGTIDLAGPGGHVGHPGLHHEIAYTPVDADLFQAWLDTHEDVGSDLVSSGAVFKKGDGGDHEKAALEREELAAHEQERRDDLERELLDRRESQAANQDDKPGDRADLDPHEKPAEPPHTTETHPLNPEVTPQEPRQEAAPAPSPAPKPAEPAKS